MTKDPNGQFFYYTINQSANAEFKDRGSKFIAYAFPVTTTESVKAHLLSLKQDHPKAVHFCYAYRIGTEGKLFRVNDDGEPSGSAGKPILNQIDSKQLLNVLVVVVRYFGGTLLGVPGLINAYKTTTALVLQLVPIVQMQIEIPYELHFDYTQMNEVMIIVKQFNCTVLFQEMQLFCQMKIGIPKSRLEEVLYKFKDLHAVTVTKLL